jgi:histidyl-tRNA synthetase
MTEAQKKKILKKRAEKEEKARKKAAAKEKKSVSLFGAGTQPICTILQGANFELLSNKATLLQIEQCLDKLLSGGVQRKPKIAKGTRDYLPDQMMIRQQAFSIIRRVFESHGAVEIDTPVFELKDTLTGKYGEDSKLIYDLANQGGEILALRYDLTVPFARFLALNSVGNIKRFHIGKVYRRDQPVLSKGRYREFYQCDFDIAGTYGRMVPDSECLCVACDILDALPIGDFAIKLNHRCLLDAILDICGVPADKFRTICSAVDKLDKEPWEEVKREMVEDKGLKPDVADQIGTFVLQKGEPWEMYNSLMDGKKFGTHKGALEAMEDLRILFEYLDAMGKLSFMSFDLSLARGLDYYTGVIYEAICLSGTAQVGSIGGGGRYDNLVSMFQEAGKITPCVGVSVGIERVFTLMEKRLEEEQGSIKQPNVKVLVASAGDGMLPEKMRVTRLLWDSNMSAEFSHQENPKLKYEITNALDREIPFMVIVGEEELKENKVQVKDLKARTEDLVSLDDLVKTLRSKGVVPVGCDFAAELFAKEKADAAAEES